MLQFNHSGNLGDILYSLYFCRELARLTPQPVFDFHIQTNVIEPSLVNQSHSNHPYGIVRMTPDSANFLAPLLKSQPFIHEVTWGDQIPPGHINLDSFRQMPINFASGDIRNWYYNISRYHLPREFWKPVLIVPETDKKYAGKILFSQTERYQNIYIDFSQLKKFEKNLVFVGTEAEYERFSNLYFPMEYCPVKDVGELAGYLNGATGFCAGECGFFAVAECMKIPRILTGPEFVKGTPHPVPGPHNVHPIGGWCEDVSTTEKLMLSIAELLNKVN